MKPKFLPPLLLAAGLLLTAPAFAVSYSVSSVTIAASGTVSTAVNISQVRIVGIEMPATFTGTTLTFQCSTDGSSYTALWSNGTQVSLTVAQGRYESTSSIAGSLASCGRWLKVVSGSTEGAQRVLNLALKK